MSAHQTAKLQPEQRLKWSRGKKQPAGVGGNTAKSTQR